MNQDDAKNNNNGGDLLNTTLKTHIDNLDESMHAGPVDLDELLANYAIDSDISSGEERDHGTLFSDDVMDENWKMNGTNGVLYYNEEEDDEVAVAPRYFNNPNRRLFDTDASLIPGSPFSKPAMRPSKRPREPLRIARYASSLAFLGTFGMVIFLFFNAVYTYEGNIGRIVVEMILALLSFFGLFWNCYFTVASILKCFIPSLAFKTNTKYCSIIPETKDVREEWLDVTIQIPVYKESLVEVLMPTLRSCITARDTYIKSTDALCNIVICDDGMMAMLRDNFPAAEMLWKVIVETHGRVLKLSKLLQFVPRASRYHLKGLRSKDVYEVFHRMLYYYHYDIGFVARSTVDRRGKFKKASNLNTHLRLALGAQQRFEKENGEVPYEQAMLEEVHNDDGSRTVMFGNDIRLGHLICVNDADARMAATVIAKTVPEFLNDKSLGFTQHATKTMTEQRGESYYTNMLAVYTDALYQGHFLLSSILGCHPPLVGHSIFLRTDAIKQCGRIRTLRKAQLWLQSIGLHFLPVDQVGFANLQAENRTEYWSESHVSEDFELMIHLYSLGFNGRYVNYDGCEFQEGITRTFDEEAGRHRKFALGAHELVFHPIQDMLSHGIFTPVFRTFLTCDIPSYYKIFLTAYLCSYASGGTYIIVFTVSAILRILDNEGKVDSISVFNPAGIIILNFIVYYFLGYLTFLIAMLRMNAINNKLFFPEYRKKWLSSCYLIFVELRYCFLFQFLFYNVATFTFYFMGSMDHLLSRPSIVGATNKDSINISRCRAFYDMAKFNIGSWGIAALMMGLAYLTMLQEYKWDVTKYPGSSSEKDDRNTTNEFLQHGLFAGPAIFLAAMAFIVPIVLNPWILGWPFLRQQKKRKTLSKKKPASEKAPPLFKGDAGQKQKQLVPSQNTVDLPTMMKLSSPRNAVDKAIMNTQEDLDLETGSLTTSDLRTQQGTPSPACRRNTKRFGSILGASNDDEKKEQYPTPPPFDLIAANRIQLNRDASQERLRHARSPSSNRSWDDPGNRALRPSKSGLSWEEPRGNISPLRRLQDTSISPVRSGLPVSRSPPLSPITRHDFSRSPGGQRSSPSPQIPSGNTYGQNRPMLHDKWGFPVQN